MFIAIFTFLLNARIICILVKEALVKYGFKV